MTTKQPGASVPDKDRNVRLCRYLRNEDFIIYSSQLTEKQGRILKLVRGIFMLFFGPSHDFQTRVFDVWLNV